MNEPFTLKGFFSLPQLPENEVPGELHYSPEDGIVLQMQGDLDVSGHFSSSPQDSRTIPLILGVTNKGESISLVDCLQIRSTTNVSEYVYVATTYHVHFAYIGIHFDSPDEVKFSEIAVRYTHLDEWFDQKPFDVVYTPISDENPRLFQVTLKYTKPDTQSADVGSYRLSFFVAGPYIKDISIGEISISQKAWVRIQSNEGKKHFDDFLTIAGRIQDFLTLGVGEPVYPIEMEGISETTEEILKRDKAYPPIKILYDRPWQPKPGRRVRSFNMLYTLKNMKDRLNTNLNNWFSDADLLTPVLNNYFPVLYREQIYSEFRFLGIVLAIEAFHRRMWGGKYQSDEEFSADLYQRLVDAIPPDLDPDFRKALIKGKLRYANEYSLRKRLQELGRHLGGYLPCPFLARGKERCAFIEDVVETRNDLIHTNQDSTRTARKTGRDYYELFRKLRVMLDALLLEKIGFDQAQITDMLKKNRFYSDLLSEA